MSRAIGTLSHIAPASSALVAEKLWLRSRGRRVADAPLGAEPFEFVVGQRDLAGYTVGEGPNVLLLHGWGGTRTDMNALAVAVAAAGHRAVVPDLPGHGRDRGRSTDLFRMAAAVDAVIALFGPAPGLVAHSFGATAALSAFPHGGPDRVAFLAPALDATPFFDWFAGHLRLSPRAVSRFHQRVRRYAGPHNMAAFRGGVAIPGASMAVFHDPADTRTSYEASLRYADRFTDVAVNPVEGVGHSRILRHGPTIDAIVQHLA